MGDDVFGELGDGFTNSPPALPEQILPSPRPVLSNSVVSGTNFQFQTTAALGGTFYLLSATNLATALSQWTTIWTNSVSARSNNSFSAMIPITFGVPQFFILRSQ